MIGSGRLPALSKDEAPGKSFQSRWYMANKEALSEERKAYRRGNPDFLARQRQLYRERYHEKHAIIMKAKRYGISKDEVRQLLANNVCEICAIECKPHIDHDHVTGLVRGALCGDCNRGLGSFKDNPAALRAAADYLEAHQ